MRLWGLVAAWIATTGLAYVAIRRGNVSQHREWMARGYAATFAFVAFRAIYDFLEAFAVGTIDERIGVAAWACWAVPLLLVEFVLSGRKALLRQGEGYVRDTGLAGSGSPRTTRGEATR